MLAWAWAPGLWVNRKRALKVRLKAAVRNEARFQRWRFGGYPNPWALPQAKLNAAPLALNMYS